jgi:hypothetical protein
VPELAAKTPPPLVGGGDEIKEGDRLEMPIAPPGVRGAQKRRVRGEVKHIDVVFRGRRYAGLVLVSESDGSCYEIVPELARKLPRTRGKAA